MSTTTGPRKLSPVVVPPPRRQFGSVDIPPSAHTRFESVVVPPSTALPERPSSAVDGTSFEKHLARLAAAPGADGLRSVEVACREARALGLIVSPARQAEAERPHREVMLAKALARAVAAQNAGRVHEAAIVGASAKEHAQKLDVPLPHWHAQLGTKGQRIDGDSLERD